MTPSLRLLALLCAALLGLLVLLGTVVHALGGPVWLLVFAVVALAGVVLAARQGRRLLAPPPLPAGRTCTCCTTSHFDPVKVL